MKQHLVSSQRSDPVSSLQNAGTFKLHRHFYVAMVLLAIPAATWSWALGSRTVESVPLREKLETIPQELGAWMGVDQEMDARIGSRPAQQSIQRTYTRGTDNPISIYIAYWGGLQGRAPHRPSACRPGSGWKVLSSHMKDYEIAGFEATARVHEEVYSRETLTDVVVWWEYLHGKNISSQWMQRLLMLLPEWMGGRKGSVLQVQVTTRLANKEAPEQGLERIRKFLGELGPELKRVLPQEH